MRGSSAPTSPRRTLRRPRRPRRRDGRVGARCGRWRGEPCADLGSVGRHDDRRRGRPPRVARRTLWLGLAPADRRALRRSGAVGGAAARHVPRRRALASAPHRERPPASATTARSPRRSSALRGALCALAMNPSRQPRCCCTTVDLHDRVMAGRRSASTRSADPVACRRRVDAPEHPAGGVGPAPTWSRSWVGASTSPW